MDQAQELLAPLGLRLPIEVAVWFGWHNGVTAVSDVRLAKITPAFEMLSLAAAVDWCRELRALAPGMSGAVVDFWRPEWFPIVRANRHTLVCDCSVPRGAPTPIRIHGLAEHPDWSAIVAPSLRAVVSRWIECWDTRAWVYDADQDRLVSLVDQFTPDGRRDYLVTE